MRVPLGAALAALAFLCASSARAEYNVQIGPRVLYPQVQLFTNHHQVPLPMRDAIEHITVGTWLLATPPRIMGGELAPVGVYPWAVSIGLKGYPPRDGHFCAGGFIAPQWVVTAAHCVSAAVEGDIQVYGDSEDLSGTGRVFPVDRVIVNDKYNPVTMVDDIALVHVTQSYRGQTLKPVTPAQEQAFSTPGTLAIGVGWGLTAEADDAQNALRRVTVAINSNPTCNGPAGYAGTVTRDMVCASFAEGGRDSCQPEAGGPLVAGDKVGNRYLVGVSSWGEGCARPNKFGVYTRVSTVEPWIAQQMANYVATAAKTRAAPPMPPPAEVTIAPPPPAPSVAPPPQVPTAPKPPSSTVPLPPPAPAAQRVVRARPNGGAANGASLPPLGPRRLYPSLLPSVRNGIPLVMRDAMEFIDHGQRLFATKPRIMGGQPAPSGAFPWMASLELSYQRRRDAHFCGGAFIAPQWVITAAHCVTAGSGNAVDVLGGTNMLDSGGALYPVDRVIVNEKYSTDTQDYDVALLHLSKPFTGQTVRLLTPADAARLAPIGALAVAAGWGLTAEGTDVSDLLREVTVQIVPNQTCNGSDAYGGAITDRMVCAGFAQGGKDSCQGDSGGPLMVSDGKGGYFQAGITSWGEGCGRPNKFGVYTRVASIADWVAEQTGSRTVLAPAAAPLLASRSLPRVAPAPPQAEPATAVTLPPSLPGVPVPLQSLPLPKPRPAAAVTTAAPVDGDARRQHLGPRRLYPHRQKEIGAAQPLVMRDALQYLRNGTRLLAVKPRIIGGEPAPPGSFPWAASLELKSRARQGNHFCGGSFIAPQWVMTAAHCVKPGSAPGIEVLGGSHELDEGGTLYPVDRVIVNEKYDDGTQDYDVALLHLTRAFTGRTIPLMTPADAAQLTVPGHPAVTIGWGLTSEDGGVSNILREVNLQIVSQQACNAPAAYNDSIGQTMICAGFAHGGKDACQGDSGGPMMVMDAAGNYVQAGIVSWGEGCGKPEKFGVYTRVSEIEAWVAGKIGSRAGPHTAAPRTLRPRHVPQARRSYPRRLRGVPVDRKYMPTYAAHAQSRERHAATPPRRRIVSRLPRRRADATPRVSKRKRGFYMPPDRGALDIMPTFEHLLR